MKNSALTVLLLILSAPAQAAETAAEPGYFNGKVGYQETSDGILDRSLDLGYRTHRRELDWPYPGEADQAWDFGISTDLHSGEVQTGQTYEGGQVALLAARKFSPRFMLEANLGPMLLNTAGQTHTTVYGDLTASWLAGEKTFLSLAIDRNYLYPDLIDPGAVIEGIAAQSLFLNFHTQPLDRLRLVGSARARAFTDGNAQREADLAALFGISPGVPWIWAGVGAEYYAYSHFTPAYWSPQLFYSFGPRFEADVPLVGKLSAVGGLNLDWLKQDQYDMGFGFYLSAYLRYGTREDYYFDAGYIRIQSKQEDSTWYDNAFVLDLNVSL